ncbi:MAG: GYD domain-containing protein [Acidobacteriota bacterium]|nr:GYD domain-containing protein [Acidobacteriota bacterium]
MPKFLVEASYTPEGLKGLMKEGGTGRREAIAAAAKSLGGKVEGMYFAFGKHDVVVIMDIPDNVTAAAMALAVNASGGAVTRTTTLLTPEEVDQAIKKTVKYRAPGKG